jgi:hypothetical protein
MHRPIELQSENLKGRAELEDLGADGRIILKLLRTGCIWLTIATSGGHMVMNRQLP